MPPWKIYSGQRCPHGKKIFLVNGTLVRNVHDSDFSQGGNGYRYRWIPKSEIWIDAAIPEDEWNFIVGHECQESELMKGGMSYDKAHDVAKRAEDRKRRGLRPEGLRPEGLRPEGKETMRRLTVRETREACNLVSDAADILQHRDVAKINFALPSTNVAKVMRDVVGRLKQRSRTLTADEVSGITHAVQTAADYLQGDQIASLGIFPHADDVGRNLRGIVVRIKMLANRRTS
jgi:hypothetical protein